MNKNIKLAVAGAVLALSATAANAGIVIPAGDWTVDINGNVNAFYIHNNSKDSNTIDGGLANSKGTNGNGASSINTGLLPSWLGVTGKTRQNDLDVEFTISMQPGASSKTSLAGGGGNENRQAYVSFGDKSWGTILIGKNLGQFGRDAILNDMTLLGVGSQGVVGTAGGTTTTLGRIGTGFIYADFQGQINYTTPNFNGFEATVGIVQPISSLNLSTSSAAVGGNQKSPAYEGVVRYSFAANDVSGKIWAEAKGQKAYMRTRTNADTYGSTATYASAGDESVWVAGIGANVKAAGFDLTGYYYNGEGVGTTAFLMDGLASNGKKRDSDGGYVQALYTLPTKTKVGVSWGESNLDRADSSDNSTTLVKSNEMWTVGAYHPLTKHLNLVAEYSRVRSENQQNQRNDSDIVDAGAILFF
jgi:predicted porin